MGQLNTIAAASPATFSDPAFGWLPDSGVRAADGDIPDFGDVRSETAAALATNVLAPLADRAVIRARGIDAEAFLQGQLSNDVRELTASRAQLSSYNNPKGRVLALFTMLRRPDSIWLETQASVAAATLKRLKMFVLRSKLTLDDAGADVLALGLSGPDAATILAKAGLPIPEVFWGCADAGSLVILRRPAAEMQRFTIHGPAASLATLWPILARGAQPVGTHAWRLLDILAGLPAIHADTAEQHVAQMLNLDKLEGISFGKGCYPGQEIVARLHYLGSLKRRMFTGFSTMAEVKRGMAVFTADGSSTQAVGDVVDSAPHPQFGQAVQVVLQVSHREAPLRLGSLYGPELQLVSS